VNAERITRLEKLLNRGLVIAHGGLENLYIFCYVQRHDADTAIHDAAEFRGAQAHPARSNRLDFVREYLKAIIANGEKQLGCCLAAVVYMIGKNSVCYMTTDADKYDYLRAYLHITAKKISSG
jgi:hypothetical protein